MKHYVEIHNMQLQAFHGVLPQEHVVGHLYRVDARLQVDFTDAMLTDRLTGTVSYADLADVITAEMQRPSQLLEHVAGRILGSIAQKWPSQVIEAQLRIEKLTPPISAHIEGCAVEVTASYDEMLLFLKGSNS